MPNSTPNTPFPSTEPNVDADEIAKFANMAASWWDPNGSFKLIHKLNPLRTDYVLQQVQRLGLNHLVGKSVLDLGCGAGILSESLALAGAKVTGLDMAEPAIQAGRVHAQASGLNISYLCQTAEELAATGVKFDVVCCMEMIEHVPDYQSILHSCAKLLKPHGLLIMSTINRTLKSQLEIIELVENYFKWLPAGTHEYQKFIRPVELIDKAAAEGLTCVDLTGYTYNPVFDSFSLCPDVDVNYLVSFVKQS